MYLDPSCGAESLVLQMGALKAGVSLVAFHEKDSKDALDHALRSTNAKGLVFSPGTQIGENTTRKTFLHELMPELEQMYPGDELNLSNYPHLQHIVQTGFSKMRGVNMFKDVAVYANPSLSNYSIPVNSSDALSHTYLKDGREVRTLTSGEFVNASEDLWNRHLSHVDDHPLFFSSDLEKPLGLASFLACSSHLKKLFLPGTFNASKMIKSIPRQSSSSLVCDEDLLTLDVPA